MNTKQKKVCLNCKVEKSLDDFAWYKSQKYQSLQDILTL